MRPALVLGLLALGCRPPTDWREPTPPTPVGPPSPATPATPPTPPDPGPTRLVNDRDYIEAAELAIDAATDQVRVAAYVIYEGGQVGRVLSALERAAARGVRVRVLADQEGDGTPWALDRLDLAGVETAFDSRLSVLHAKLIVADGVALVGSHNLTHAAMASNHEASALVADPQVAAWYGAWFDALWEAPDPWPDLAPLDREDLRPLADRAVSGALRDCIDAAAHEVELVLYALAWYPEYPGSDVDLLLGALESAHARGVQVRVTLDQSPWIATNGINELAWGRLVEAGIDVGPAPSGVLTHAKLLRCDGVLIVSDANWSHSGLALVRGTSLRTTVPALVSQGAAWAATLR